MPGWLSWLSCPTLDFCSDLDIRVVSLGPMLRSVLDMESTLKKKVGLKRFV